MYFTPVYNDTGLHMKPGLGGLGDVLCGPDQDPEFDDCTIPNIANLMKPLNEAQQALVKKTSDKSMQPKSAGLDNTTLLIGAVVVLALVMRR